MNIVLIKCNFQNILLDDGSNHQQHVAAKNMKGWKDKIAISFLCVKFKQVNLLVSELLQRCGKSLSFGNFFPSSPVANEVDRFLMSGGLRLVCGQHSV